jgi:hypothetical protein
VMEHPEFKISKQKRSEKHGLEMKWKDEMATWPLRCQTRRTMITMQNARAHASTRWLMNHRTTMHHR